MRSTLLVVLLLALFFWIGKAFAGEQKPSSNVVDATRVAYEDFEKRLAERTDREGNLAQFVLNAKNYDVGVSQTDSEFVVVFKPKQTPRRILGGGGQYFIRKSDLSIVGFMGYK